MNTEDDEQDTCDEPVRMNQQYISYPVFYEQTGKCNIPVVSDNISCVCEPTNSKIKVTSKYFLTADKLNYCYSVITIPYQERIFLSWQ